MKYQQLNQLIYNLNQVVGQETKTAKKLYKIYEKVKTHHEDYQAKVEALRLDNAQVDDKDCLVLNEKGEYRFTK
jgi:phosphoglycerate-specific signal transduction histidine kinase